MGGSSELFVNCLVAIVDRYLPKEPADEEIDEMIRTPITPKWPNLSGSMNSLVLSSPADRGKQKHLLLFIRSWNDLTHFILCRYFW